MKARQLLYQRMGARMRMHTSSTCIRIRTHTSTCTCTSIPQADELRMDLHMPTCMCKCIHTRTCIYIYTHTITQSRACAPAATAHAVRMQCACSAHAVRMQIACNCASTAQEHAAGMHDKRGLAGARIYRWVGVHTICGSMRIPASTHTRVHAHPQLHACRHAQVGAFIASAGCAVVNVHA
jgi:hypothetical protein